MGDWPTVQRMDIISCEEEKLNLLVFPSTNSILNKVCSEGTFGYDRISVQCVSTTVTEGGSSAQPSPARQDSTLVSHYTHFI